MKIRWLGDMEEKDPQVRDLPVKIIDFEQGVVIFKDRHGSALLMLPVDRLIEAEQVTDA